jgi:hypothetical protein
MANTRQVAFYCAPSVRTPLKRNPIHYRGANVRRAKLCHDFHMDRSPRDTRSNPSEFRSKKCYSWWKTKVLPRSRTVSQRELIAGNSPSAAPAALLHPRVLQTTEAKGGLWVFSIRSPSWSSRWPKLPSAIRGHLWAEDVTRGSWLRNEVSFRSLRDCRATAGMMTVLSSFLFFFLPRLELLEIYRRENQLIGQRRVEMRLLNFTND